MPQLTLGQLVKKLASRKAARTEATVQADVRQLLLEAPLNLTEEVLLEPQVGDGRRIDVEVGATVIEVKKDLSVGNVRTEAVKQLRGYVESRQAKHGVRYVGILTDGADWYGYRLQNGSLEEVTKHQVDAARPNEDALCIWLEGILRTTRDIRPTPEEIRQRLSAGTSAHELDRASLAALFEANKDLPTVQTKRSLWARLLQTALGTQFDDSDELFIEHTLLVNTAEIIAHAVLGLAPEALSPRSLLSGEKFIEAGVLGVVEADFFDWIVEVEGGEAFVRSLARNITRFDWQSVEHDVLKVLYESVIRAEVRKKLGEYYTPDWLAEKMVETVIKDPLAQRVLDPACGSGTFLFHAVRRYVEAGEKAGASVRDLLDGVTSHVLGMDLHPVAVSLARVTYLLAIGKKRLLSPQRDRLRIPVFLGDSLQWRQKNPTLFSTSELTIPVDDRRALTTAEFRFPSTLLKDAASFDDLVSELADLAARRRPGAKLPSLAPLFKQRSTPKAEQGTISESFQMMCKLHDEGRDHIWGYYIRNLARPEWLARAENRVDVLVGNPPWLKFSYMTERMQQEFRTLSEARALWHGAGTAPHQDLSALFVVRAVEHYLKPGGSFGFVMPSAVLDRKQYVGFRAGTYDDQDQVRVTFGKPWDLRELRPHFFPITASVIFGRRTPSAGELPAEGEAWSGKLPGGDLPWKRVAALIERTAGQVRSAEPEDVSPYHERFTQGATIVPRVLFMVEELDPGPLGQVRNRVAVRSMKSATEKRPWKDLDRLEGVIESEFIYSVHLGETVLPYRTLEPRRAVLPITSKGRFVLEEHVLPSYKGLATWWAKATDMWDLNRSSERLSLEGRLNYHRGLTGQFRIPPRRIVYTKSGMHLAAAVVEDHRAVIDHKLYWAGLASKEEGHYLCAILNSAVATRRVQPLMSYGKDERDIDKYIWKLPIPMFDPDDRAHAHLAELGRQAGEAIAALELDDSKHFSAMRRAVRAWLEESKIGQAIEAKVEKLLGA
jgi:SAM-dependent methyltransferase